VGAVVLTYLPGHQWHGLCYRSRSIVVAGSGVAVIEVVDMPGCGLVTGGIGWLVGEPLGQSIRRIPRHLA
jgi:hypothetical protein